MCTRSNNQIPSKKHHLSDIYDLYWKQYINSKDRKLFLEPKHFEAINKARVCGTDKLGIAILSCIECGDTISITRSCKHRFCARCGNADTNKWANLTLSKLINDKHHHVVTTLPKQLRALAKMNHNLLFDLLFKVSAQILKSWFNAKHNLLPGIVSVLHTAGSDLKYHPHIHMLVSGGGKDLENGTYRMLDSNYLCDQQFLGRQLKIKFCQQLIKLYKHNKIKVHHSLQHNNKFISWILNIKDNQWIVSVQKSLDDVQQIVGYVGRYTKRACLSEYKIEAIQPNIKFRFIDYVNSKREQKPLEAIREMKPLEFLDALLQHVPDKKYRMIRYFGLYNSRHLKHIPQHLKLTEKKLTEQDLSNLQDKDFQLYRIAFIKAGKPDPIYCKFCKRDKVLVGIQYQNKYIDLYQHYDDSS